MADFDRTIQRFASADSQLRLELLLDYARKLPALPERYQLARDKGENRVPECMSPVFLFLEANNGEAHPLRRCAGRGPDGARLRRPARPRNQGRLS